jgi:hypothetical protein
MSKNLKSKNPLEKSDLSLENNPFEDIDQHDDI